MRPVAASLLIALSLASTASGARADVPTTLLVRNVGAGSTRVQVALGPAMPCDSSENRVMYDFVIAAGATRVLPLEQAIIACARHTSAGSTLDWQQSTWVRGGYRCRGGKGGPCWRDPSVPILLDVDP